MQIAIISSDNRNLISDYNNTNYVSLAAFLNYNYADQNGYKYQFFIPELDNEPGSIFNCVSLKGNKRHASWSKLLSCLKFSTENTNYDYVVWCDSDCIFNKTLKVDDYLRQSKIINGNSEIEKSQFIFISDKPWSYNEANAGFFIYKNNKESLNIIKDWYSYDNSENNNYHDYGHAWEQVALRNRYYAKYKQQMSIIDDEFCFAAENITKDSFLIHLTSSNSEENRQLFFKQKIESLKLQHNFSDTIESIKNKTIRFDTKNILKKLF